jgi:hypothetical protein
LLARPDVDSPSGAGLGTHSDFKDPTNKEEILAELRELKTMGKVHDLIKRSFPGWIIGTLSQFCDGYPHLNYNWGVLCKKIGVKPTQIVIVRKLSLDNDHELLRNFVECLIRSGFAVRSMIDYVPCVKCTVVAIPTPPVYSVMKEKGLKIPETSTMVCKNCR